MVIMIYTHLQPISASTDGDHFVDVSAYGHNDDNHKCESAALPVQSSRPWWW